MRDIGQVDAATWAALNDISHGSAESRPYFADHHVGKQIAAAQIFLKPDRHHLLAAPEIRQREEPRERRDAVRDCQLTWRSGNPLLRMAAS